MQSDDEITLKYTVLLSVGLAPYLSCVGAPMSSSFRVLTQALVAHPDRVFARFVRVLLMIVKALLKIGLRCNFAGLLRGREAVVAVAAGSVRMLSRELPMHAGECKYRHPLREGTA